MHGILEDGGILHEEEGEVNSVDTERVDDTFGLRERGVGVPVTEADGRGVALGNKTELVAGAGVASRGVGVDGVTAFGTKIAEVYGTTVGVGIAVGTTEEDCLGGAEIGGVDAAKAFGRDDDIDGVGVGGSTGHCFGGTRGGGDNLEVVLWIDGNEELVAGQGRDVIGCDRMGCIVVDVDGGVGGAELLPTK